jgi:lysozyme|tara:strand:- start:187 stop:597 length:411 start_codon:yes stop_codon:yes gene_type:complete
MNREQLIEELKRDEGVVLTLYQCSAGKNTIGVGRNLDDRGITDDESDYLLSNDIDICIEELTNAFPWFVDLSDTRQRVMVNMCFNLGLSRLMGFKNFLAAMEAGDWETAGVEMLDSKWAVQVGPRSTRLKDLVLEG